MKRPMTPVEFDAAKRELERRCPFLSATSGRRHADRNLRVGGRRDSKHAMLPCMAQDYVADSQELMEEGAHVAVSLGMWTLIHDVGVGNHLHTQGLPTGPPSEQWLAEHGEENGKE